MSQKCKNPSCTKEVVSIEGRRPKEFCSVECRTKFHNSKNKKEGGKRGRPAGSKNKVRAGIDEFSVDGSVSVVTVYKKDGITPIETPVAIYHSAKEPMLDTIDMANKIAEHYSAPIKIENEYKFGDEKWLVVEKYTKFPDKERPIAYQARREWDAQKKQSDQLIKDAWAKYKAK